MINGSLVIAMIPARGGSKGFPGKNLALLGGQSVIARSISAAKGSQWVDRIIVSTDSEEIAAEARRAGAEVPFLRPAELATDQATSASVAEHLLTTLGITSGFLVLLQPTSPLRTMADVDACLSLAGRPGSSSAVSVTETDKPPHWIFKLDDHGHLKPYFDVASRPTRRQDAPPGYVLNGAVYVVRIEAFLADGAFVPPDAAAYVMPHDRSVDIDHPEDLAYAEHLLQQAERRHAAS